MNAIYQNPSTRDGARKQSGRWGEAIAARYLVSHGYQVVAQNVEYRDGEVDLVAIKGGILFFVEVKTRADEQWGAAEAVTAGKRWRLMRAATRFVQERGLTGAPSQFDCVVVLGRPGDRTARVRHYRNIGG